MKLFNRKKWNMKNIIIYLFVLLTSNIYAQCNNYNEFNCSNDNNCEWTEDIEWGSCNQLNPSMSNGVSYCNDPSTNTDQCYTYTCYGGSYGSWGTCCGGDDYEIDNSYCEEVEIIECSEMNLLQCVDESTCEWTEDIEIGNCSVFDNSESSCTSYPSECFWDEDTTYASCNYSSSGACNSVEGCYWDCSDYGWYCDCYGQQQIIDTECVGQYEIDNSYCEEVAVLDCSEMNHGPCMSNSECEWVEDVETGNCSDINNGSECYATNQCSWYSAGSYGYWYDNCYGGTYTYDNSYCQEVEFQLGDINGDSSINILDVIQIVNLILENEYSQAVDMNYDGNVNVLDIVIIVEIILGN